MRYAAASVNVRPMSRFFKALGDETRLRIVALLSHGELCVCHVEAALNLSQPNASRHLAILKTAEIVEDRRDGNWVYYRLIPQVDEGRRRQLEALVQSFSAQELLRQDVEQLLRAKGRNACR